MTNPQRVPEADDQTNAYKLVGGEGKRHRKCRRKSLKALTRDVERTKKKYEEAERLRAAAELEHEKCVRERRVRKDLCPFLGDALLKAAGEDVTFQSAVLDHLKKKLSESNFERLKKLLQVQCDRQQSADQPAVSSSQDSADPLHINAGGSRARTPRRGSVNKEEQSSAAITDNEQADVPKTSATQSYTGVPVDEAKPREKPSPFASLQPKTLTKKSK